jgi:hypothetical protein
MARLFCIEETVGLAGGCLWLACGGGGEAALAGALGAAGLAAVVLDKLAKRGPESKRTLARIRRKILVDFENWTKSEGGETRVEVEQADKALQRALHRCFLSHIALAATARHKEGFVVAAGNLILNELAKREDLFSQPHTIARRFADAVIASALTAAFEDRNYFEAIEPYLLLEALKGIGTLHSEIQGVALIAQESNLILHDMYTLMTKNGGFDRAREAGLTEKQVRNLLSAFSMDGVEIDQAEEKLLQAAQRLAELEQLFENSREETDVPVPIYNMAGAAIQEANLPLAEYLLLGKVPINSHPEEVFSIIRNWLHETNKDEDEIATPNIGKPFVPKGHDSNIGASSRSVKSELNDTSASHSPRNSVTSKLKTMLGKLYRFWVRRDSDAKDQHRSPKHEEEPISTALAIDVLRIELGYQLVPLLHDVKGHRITDQISALRRQLATEYGFVMPSSRIIDNMQLSGHGYRIRIKEVDAGSGELFPGALLAMESKGGLVELPGSHATEPAFGLPGKWINTNLREEASFRGYTVVDPAAVLTTHLAEVLKSNMSELLTYAETKRLLNDTPPDLKCFVDDLVPSKVSFSEIQLVLQRLLRERVSIRDLQAILESIAEAVLHTRNSTYIAEHVRGRLGRRICEANFAPGGYLPLIRLPEIWEQNLAKSIVGHGEDRELKLEPKQFQEFAENVLKNFDSANQQNEWPVLLTSGPIRPFVQSMVERVRPKTVVMSESEIHPSVKCHVLPLAPATA